MEIKSVVKGFLLALIITFAALAALTVAAYTGTAGDNIINIGVYVLTAAAVIAGAVLTAKKSSRKILLNCMMMAVLYIVMLIAASLVTNGVQMFDVHFLLLVLGVILCSFFGAVIGK